MQTVMRTYQLLETIISELGLFALLAILITKVIVAILNSPVLVAWINNRK